VKPELSREIPDVAALPMALAWVSSMVAHGLRAGPVVVKLGRPKRSTPQSDKFWAMMTDLSKQVVWYGRHLTKEAWRDVLTAALKRQDVVPNIEGDGFVAIGARTRDMTKREMSDLIELATAFGSERGVNWTE
jgi:hypothetical protein